MKACDFIFKNISQAFRKKYIFDKVVLMADVLNEPQFQIFTHQKTGVKTGRIYFPALFISEYYKNIAQWLQKQEIIFCEQDLKQYPDGSFRLYFRTNNSLENEYFQLIKPLTGSK